MVCHHFLTLTKDKKVYGWGKNQFSQIINNRKEKIYLQIEIPLFCNYSIIKIASGGHHSLILTKEKNFKYIFNSYFLNYLLINPLIHLFIRNKKKYIMN